MHPGMILTIFKKDVRDAIRDSRVIAALLIPLGIGVFYGFMFDDEEFTLPPVEVIYYSEDGSQVPERLQDITAGSADLELTQADNPDMIREQISDSEGDVGIILPEGFDDQVAAGESPPLDIIVREESGSGVNYVVAALEQTLQEMAGRAPPATVQLDVIVDEEDTNATIFDDLGARQYFVLAAIIMLIGMNAMLVVPLILAEEAEKKTLDALIMVASYADVVVAKAMVGLFYVALSTILLLTLTALSIGNAAIFAAAVALFATGLIGIGLLIGSMFTNANQVNTWAGFFLLPVIAPAFMVGFPIPDILETILLFLSTSQAMRLMINAVAGEALFPDMWLSFVVLIVWIVAAYALLTLRLSRRQA